MLCCNPEYDNLVGPGDAGSGESGASSLLETELPRGRIARVEQEEEETRDGKREVLSRRQLVCWTQVSFSLACLRSPRSSQGSALECAGLCCGTRLSRPNPSVAAAENTIAPTPPIDRDLQEERVER